MRRRPEPVDPAAMPRSLEYFDVEEWDGAGDVMAAWLAWSRARRAWLKARGLDPFSVPAVVRRDPRRPS